MKKILAAVFAICLFGAFSSFSFAGPLDGLKDKLKGEEINTQAAESGAAADTEQAAETDSLKDKVQDKVKTEAEKMKEKMK